MVDIGGFACFSVTPIPTILAATCSFLAATVVNFLLTSRFVFRVTATVRRYLDFVAGSLLSLLVNVSLTSIGAILLAIPRTEAKTIAVGITFILSFWINHRLVFRRELDPSVTDILGKSASPLPGEE